MATKTIYPTGGDTQRCALRAPVALLHGFTQNHSVLEPFARLLAELTMRKIELVDLPGHGDSSGVVLGLEATADLIAESAPGAVLVGYSLGGRIGLTLAHRHPQALAALVVLGANPGLADPGEREARLAADRQLAGRLKAVEGTDELRAFLTAWLGNSLFGGIPAEAAGLEARLSNQPGPMSEMLVATSLGVQEDLWGAAREMEIPVLYVHGERDEKFSSLAKRYCGGSEGRVSRGAVPGAAHYVIGEAPYATAVLIAGFLEEAGVP
ncbi:MAG: alpha/beta fold hydrolase [Actinomycetota bacterium]|nr:alpha/beta fold hydrolase [Actinomycetota bacterium]